ncbi:BREX-1 system adenine-specific DNA-methyltransferase PglX [Nocardia salmonicida]|uniref:BREX-1 system adenine-specific DNA-methyltransferase PglX n=1 Tax=Nocardia salmonicida TaxID=53431 RepID=UPI0007A38675|nr:BREX-1 system adenine-specific DNA-methyltransferase PglX [Nocardia salmonicida]
MDTKSLERFATQARRELLTAVEAQASAVLAAGSVARSERSEPVKRLERDIAKHGQKHVIDKVAYTWFNRLIALRYMDARGYTSAGIVSPVQGHDHGQPEILADAKRGHLDTDVVTSGRTADAILGLLDGTRRSTDAEGEAYALLLTEYCRHWNKAMPFMFEREGDYTELLVPSGLLADGAILSCAREVLTEDVCKDVEVIGWLYQFYISERKDEVFAGFKKNKKAGAEEIPAATQLFTPHWIVRYLVENSLGRLWMLNRPTSRLVDRMEYYIAPVDEEADFLKINGPEELTVIDPACGSGHMLTYAFDLLYAIYEEDGIAPSEIPSLILAHNLYGTEIDPRAGSLAAFALTMKARDSDRRFFTRSQVKPKICVIEPISFGSDELDFLVTKDGDRHAEEAFWNQFSDADRLGALIQPAAEETQRSEAVLAALDDDGDIFHWRTLEVARNVIEQAAVLSREYAIAVANPPYMGSKNMDTRLTEFAKAEYKESKSDLFAMFIQRCLALTAKHGATAMITMQSWMFISSYEDLRQRIVRSSPPVSMVHLGERAFDSIPGAVVSTTAFVLEPGRQTARLADFVRAVNGQNEAAKRTVLLDAAQRIDCEWRFAASSEDFAKVPGSPIAYWLSDVMRTTFTTGQPLRLSAEPRKGMDTGDNARFLRGWWEVSQRGTSLTEFRNGTWNAYNKGGGFRKWYGYREFLVDWRHAGTEMRTRSGSRYFGRSGWTWGTVTSGGLSMRFTPEGAAFDNGGCTLFSGRDLSVPALILNSTTADAILAAISPTLNFQPINIGAVPIIDSESIKAAASESIQDLIDTSRSDWDDFETSWEFQRPSLFNSALVGGPLARRYGVWSSDQSQTSREQQTRERENNRVVAEAYGLADEVSVDVPLHRVSLTRNVEFRYGPGKSDAEYEALERADVVAELISYAVGCMFGRYSLDEPGLILADQGATLQDYLAKVSSPTFEPDADNVIPFVDDGWFEDDIVERFRQFMRTAFGAEHFEENLRFVEESLGVKAIRDYFIATSNPSGKSVAKSTFYDDHVQRYKKRPIYWMFSSPKGSFNALVYLHRYTPSTVSTVLNEYLREYRAKLEVAFQRAEEAAAGGVSAKEQKEADRLRAILAELRDYEHDVLYQLDIQRVEIDLDDGVKVNYSKFYPAVRKITGLEVSDG